MSINPSASTLRTKGSDSVASGAISAPHGAVVDAVTSKVLSLADWLHEDIRRRGLRTGDRYLTSEEAARMLEVSTGTAHQAMRVLVDRNILERRRKHGTFVSTAVDPPVLGVRPRVYVLSPSDSPRDPTYSRLSEGFYPAIVETLNGAALQLEFLPAGDGMSFVRTLAHEAKAAGDLGGFILIRSSYEVQEFFQEHRGQLPAVVFGGTYPSITALPSLDADQWMIGRMSAEYVLRKGHKRLAVVRNDHWSPGDSKFISGLTETLESSDRHVDRLEICSLPPYERVIEHRLRELLSCPERPTAIIAHTALQLSVIEQLIADLKLDVPQDIDLVMAALGYVSPLSTKIPHLESEMTVRDMGETIGHMLAALRKGQQPDPFGVTFPVRLVTREN